ncbi:IMP cyclohydrolase [ANME-1 cluster archaeon AG-394-G06]|nr:IMP cyclohydrolase [ANME-1 cluster archaeon AG-394-G06]
MVYFNEQKMKALISVYNKDIVVEFARALNELGLEVIATEGTARLILDNGIPVTKVSAFTGVQEMLGGKLKTLHPTIHAGIATAAIEIVVVNLIPLDSSSGNRLDNMDLGGVAMLRSGIKNFEHVVVIVNPARYTEIIDELRVSGQIARGTRLRLAQEASKYLVAYESKINELLERLE